MGLLLPARGSDRRSVRMGTAGGFEPTLRSGQPNPNHERDSTQNTTSPAGYTLVSVTGARYPENQKMFVPKPEEPLRAHWQRFFDLREDLLLNYGYNTARAYWTDLDGWFRWAIERDKDILNLSEKDIRRYLALLRRRGYSESTIRRRVTALRLIYDKGVETVTLQTNPAATVVVSKPRPATRS